MKDHVAKVADALWNFRNDDKDRFMAISRFMIQGLVSDVSKPWEALMTGRDRAMGALLDHLENQELLPTLIGLDPLLDEIIQHRMKK